MTIQGNNVEYIISKTRAEILNLENPIEGAFYFPKDSSEIYLARLGRIELRGGSSGDELVKVGYDGIPDYLNEDTFISGVNHIQIKLPENKILKGDSDGVANSVYDEGFKPIYFWDFNSDNVADWTQSGVSLSTPDDSITRYTALTNDPYIYRDVNFDGGQNKLIKIRYKIIAETSFSNRIYYATSGHNYSESYIKHFDLINNSEWNILELNMSDLTAGGTDWIDNTITAIRFDFGDSDDVVIDIDWIGIGKVGYGTQYFEEETFFDGDVNINKNVLISYKYGPSNIDHIWHDDSNNRWNFCSNTTYKGAGNSALLAGSFVKNGGTSSQFLKADGSVDSNSYLTSYSETDTLATVTNRGNSTTNVIGVGGIDSSGEGSFGTKVKAYLGSGNSVLGAISNGGYLSIYDSLNTENVLFRSYGDSFIRGGSLAIGKDTASYPLDVNGSGSFAGDIVFNNYALISSVQGADDFDHIWHDDSNNRWNFCSNTTYKGAGNSALLAGSFVKNGGTYYQFLKADGSVDSNIYFKTAGYGLTSSSSTVSLGTPSTITNGTSNTSYGTTHTHALQVDPNDIISSFVSVSLGSSTYNWNLTTTPNIYDTTIGAGTVTINISAMSSGMSGMCDFKTSSSASTLVLSTTISGCTVFVDSGADLTLDVSTEYFLTVVRAGNKIKFNLAKYV